MHFACNSTLCDPHRALLSLLGEGAFLASHLFHAKLAGGAELMVGVSIFEQSVNDQGILQLFSIGW